MSALKTTMPCCAFRRGLTLFSDRTALQAKTWLLRKHFEAQLRAARPTTGHLILDVGCGDKPFRHLIERSHGTYIGIDRRAASADVLADMTCLPLADRTVDTVLCLQVLDDVPDPARALRELARVLRPRGSLLLSANQSWRVHDAPNDYLRFTRFGLKYYCEHAGLNIVSIHPMGGLWALMANRLVFRLHDAMSWGPLLPLIASVVGLFIQFAGAAMDRLDYHPEDTQANFVLAVKAEAQ